MKLLVVDDEKPLCELLKEHFEQQFDCEVLTATTPGEALRLLEKEQPEGMLLDVHLKSRLSGLDVLARARQISPGTKVIMVTAVNDLECVKKARELGAVDYITKPFSVAYLENTVATKITKHLMYA
jgi:DNA-binding response OmpR family regulator